MALKPCRECGKEISTEASVCPNCGKTDPTTVEAGRASVPRVSKKMGCLLGLVALFIIGTFAQRGAMSPSQTPAEVRAAAVTRAADSTDMTRIEFTQEPIGDFDKDGKAGYAIKLTNPSHRTFTGTVTVNAIDAADGVVDWEIFGPLTLSADGGTSRGVAWFKNPMAIRTMTAAAEGKFQELAPISTQIPFTELAVLDGRSVFIYTTSRDSVALMGIARAYSNRYSATEGLFRVEFFHDKRKAARKFPMSDAALSVLTATYTANRANAFEQLVM